MPSAGWRSRARRCRGPWVTGGREQVVFVASATSHLLAASAAGCRGRGDLTRGQRDAKGRVPRGCHGRHVVWVAAWTFRMGIASGGSRAGPARVGVRDEGRLGPLAPMRHPWGTVALRPLPRQEGEGGVESRGRIRDGKKKREHTRDRTVDSRPAGRGLNKEESECLQ